MEESLLSRTEDDIFVDTSTPTVIENSNDTSTPIVTMSVDEQEALIRERQEILSNPERQAEIVFTNYINSLGRVLDGATKRKIRREIERNAKKGRYRKMFLDEYSGKNAERRQKNFQKLND